MEPVEEFAHLEQALLAACAQSIDPHAWGLVSALRAGIRYAAVDVGARQIVLDYRALMLGIVTVGDDQNYRASYHNSATWFVDWLRPHLTTVSMRSALEKYRTAETDLRDAALKEYSVTPSETVQALLKEAEQYSLQTMNRREAGLRHLVAALMASRTRPMALPEFGWKLGDTERGMLAGHLLAQIERSPEKGEDTSKWRALFAQITSGQAPPEDPSEDIIRDSAYFVSGFSADRTTGQKGDPLETDADVLAMARLICHEDADPPISIGVFGGWGSGKSTFMEALQQQVALLSAPGSAGHQPADGPRFVSPIVQIRFNAWQFADANLWASLTAEFFDQLRAGGFEGGGKRIHARLIQDVNEHVRGLSREAGVRRTAVDLAESRLRDAQIRHDDAVRDKKDGVGQALVSGLAEAYRRNKSELERYGLVDPRSTERLAQFIAVARDGRTQAGQLRHIGTILLAQWPLLLAVLSLAAIVAAAALAIAPNHTVAATIASAVTAAAGILPVARRGLEVIHTIVRQVGPVADKIAEAEKQGLKQVLETEVALRSATEESEALRAVAERADRALARYVDPSARSNPPRVLRYLLEDDPNTKAFEREIGLIGRARRLFQALDEIVAENDSNKDRLRALRDLAGATVSKEMSPEMEALEKAIDDDIPDRIILYVDDLDRCTHEQVYRVLQAVHLLLAFRLFVVVVAVDMAWVEAAVATSIEFAGNDSETDETKEKERRRRAIEYLSKIFQLPFWLKPFSPTDDQRYQKFVRSLSGVVPPAPPPRPAPLPMTSEPDSSAGETSESTADSAQVAGAEPDTTSGGSEPQRGRHENAEDEVARGLKTLQLTQAEEDFLAGSAIAALAASDPRGVKRLINVYKIVRARLSETDDAMILGDSSRPPAYPLIALCAAIETGQTFEVADRFYGYMKSGASNAGLAFQLSNEIKTAVAAAVTARGGRAVSVKEALEVARVVRRYSFNRFH